MAKVTKVSISFKEKENEIFSYNSELCFIEVYPKDGVLYIKKRKMDLDNYGEYVSTLMFPLETIEDAFYVGMDDDELIAQYINEGLIDINDVLSRSRTSINYTRKGYTIRESLWVLLSKRNNSESHIFDLEYTPYFNQRVKDAIKVYFWSKRKNSLKSIKKEALEILKEKFTGVFQYEQDKGQNFEKLYHTDDKDFDKLNGKNIFYMEENSIYFYDKSEKVS